MQGIRKYISKGNVVDLGKRYVLSSIKLIKGTSSSITYSLDNITYFKTYKELDNLDNLVCRYLKFESEVEIEITLGTGYIGYKNEKWTSRFVRDYMWTGGDGLYSFNLTGKDNYLAKENDKTLLVFGDTFVGTLSDSKVRLAPLAMPNNSYVELDNLDISKANISFNVNEDELGHIKAYLEPDNELCYEGTHAYNLVNYSSKDTNYLSGWNPKKDIEIEFKFLRRYVKFVRIYNYFEKSEIDYNYQNRGVKHCLIKYNASEKEVVLNKSSHIEKAYTDIKIDQEVDRLTLVIPSEVNRGNYGGANLNEPLYGLNKVYFYIDEENFLQEVEVKANSELLKKDKHAWFWLQDGIVIKNDFFSLPFVVTSDPSQPEGFQFAIEGIALTKSKIKKGHIDFKNTKQVPTNLCRKEGLKNIVFGCGFYNNSFSSKEKKADGYIYIYGYLKDLASFELGNQLIVARVKEEDFEDINSWTYYDGTSFVKDITKVKGLVPNVSCELSVSYDEDKYILVFTYNVQSRYVAYALSDTPYGPFSEMRVSYVADENLCEHMYIYNAKGHPHLSKENNLLVSYNVNTSNFDENINFGRTYGPRFINLRKESEEHEG